MPKVYSFLGLRNHPLELLGSFYRTKSHESNLTYLKEILPFEQVRRDSAAPNV